MLFEMYGDVILTRDVTEHGLRAGDLGTVVERHAVPGVLEEGYSVEFFDMTGNTVTVATLPASALRLPTPADRPAVRPSAAESSDSRRTKGRHVGEPARSKCEASLTASNRA
jgi:hypothetical protein